MFSSASNVLRSEECSSRGGMRNLVVGRNLAAYSDRTHESSLFSLTSEEDEDVHYDTSDVGGNGEVLMGGRPYPSIREFACAIPNHLLLGSLLEHLCFLYESDPTRSRMLFKVIGQRLTAMNLLSPLAISDEFSTVRLQHHRAFTELLHTSSASLLSQGQQLLNSDSQNLPIRPREGLFQAQTSRYLSEFEEVSRLGKGSYGKVFKVINKLDGQYYAVKKILIKNISREDCMKVLREVKVLSGLQHINVVGYHTAWVEHVQPAAPSSTLLPALESSTQTLSTDDSGGSSVVFQSSPAPLACPQPLRCLPDNYVPCVFLGGADRTDTHAVEVQFHLMLYIQMQLCERSLKDWICERNTRLSDPAWQGPGGCVDEDQTLLLLRSILEGVHYIHSRGIMHRDLKPRNIFLHGQDCHVRIGDFGLACRNILVDDQEPSTSHTAALTHTTGVGTFVYAAPEQLAGSHYDLKSDMYSVGVLTLELFQPFGTEMERVKTLEGLREGRLPASFLQRWPVLAQHVLLLSSTDPRLRPTAQQLLQGELFSCRDAVIHGLQRRVEEQEEEILLLRRQISQMQISKTASCTGGVTTSLEATDTLSGSLGPT